MQSKPKKVLSKTNLKNIKILRDYLAGLPPRYQYFNMTAYATIQRVSSGFEGLDILEPVEATECGSVCCMVGHGPAAGLKPRSKEAKHLWRAYQKEKFGDEFSCWNGNRTDKTQLMEYMFASGWGHKDKQKTLKAGIKRLDEVLASGGRLTESMQRKLQTLAR